MENLYGYVFHYNHYTELWSAIPRELYLEYWSDDGLEGIVRSKEISTLVELLTKKNIQIQ